MSDPSQHGLIRHRRWSLHPVSGELLRGFWPCSGRFEVVVLFGMLSLVAQFVYWSRIVSGLNQEHA